MRITFVVAAGTDGTIGDKGRLPWRLPSDLKRFRRLTMGKPVIMGRKTHESIGKVLDGRLNVVMTRAFRPDVIPGVLVARSRDEILDVLAAEPVRRRWGDEAIVIGGAEIYRLFADLCAEIHFTRVAGDFGGDTRFSWGMLGPQWDGCRTVREEQVYRDDNPGDSHDSLYRVFAKREV